MYEKHDICRLRRVLLDVNYFVHPGRLLAAAVGGLCRDGYRRFGTGRSNIDPLECQLRGVLVTAQCGHLQT